MLPSRRRSPVVLLFLAVSALFISDVGGKRTAPPRVAPLVFEGVRYTASHQTRGKTSSGRTGFLAFVTAADARTGKRIWRARAYEIVYDPDLETDVQDVWIVSLRVRANRLVVTDERNQQYALDLKTGRAVPPRPAPPSN